MALTVYTNNYSIIAQNSLANASKSMTKSIERLSSGLRINHAADDASGLAISEKLRSQIRGIGKAYMNAQDAISFLQTAEGGMEVIGDMLQRMRELAVQAGNGTYTTNDRKQLQLEVDQLKSEINRVTSSTEYNTKKLLTGAAAALWSSSSPDVQGIVRGAPAEGNYRLEITTDPAASAIYKSDIMDVIGNNSGAVNMSARANAINMKIECSGGLIAAEYLRGNDIIGERFTVSQNNAVTTTGITTHSVAGFNATDATFTLVDTTSAFSGYVVAEVMNNYDPAGDNKTVKLQLTYIIASSGATFTQQIAIQAGGAATAAGMEPMFSAAGSLMISLADVSYKAGSKIAVNFQKAAGAGNVSLSSDNYGSVGITATGTAVTIYALKKVEIGKETEIAGFRLAYAAAPTTGGGVNTITALDGPKSTNLSVRYQEGPAGVYNIRTSSANVTAGIVAHSRFTSGSTVSIGTTPAAAGAMSISAGATGPSSTGYLVLEYLSDRVGLSANSTVSILATWVNASTGEKTTQTLTVSNTATVNFSMGGNSFRLDAGTIAGRDFKSGDKYAFTIQAAITNGFSMSTQSVDGRFPAAGGAQIPVTPGNTIGLYAMADLSLTGGKIDMVGLSVNASRDLRAGLDTVIIDSKGSGAKAGGIADLNTRLSDIGRFTNVDGRMILENTQELTIYAGGKSASLFIGSMDTVQDLKDKLIAAMIELGLGATASSAGSQAEADKINANLVQYVTAENKTALGNTAVEGTFVIQAATMGSSSVMSFSGDESLINALSLAQIQQEGRPLTTVNVYDAHTNKHIGGDTVSDGILRGVIKGIDVKFASTVGTEAKWDPQTNSIVFRSTANVEVEYLHIVDNRTEVQIGANEGQTFDISIAQLDTTALEIDDVYVTTMGLSQKAITKLDMALERINSNRATIGAQINRLEYTMQNLSVSKQNLVAGESRIRDADLAEESSIFARNQILVNAATAMLAQANQLPQMALQLIG